MSIFKEIMAELGYANSDRFLFIGGPCVVEGYDVCMRTAEELLSVCNGLGIPYVFKSSYRKANRTSPHSFETIGIDKALNILRQIKEKLHCPILTDIHSVEEANMVADFVDIIQIPAFLCRQTDILVAAAKTGKIVNIKKGQFTSAFSILMSAEKVKLAGNTKVMITERGNSFGYTDLIVDFRNIRKITEKGIPAIIDATHSLQKPNTEAGYSRGEREYAEVIARCGIVVGACGVFMEVHPDPSSALSDKETQIPLNSIKSILVNLNAIWETVKNLSFVALY